MFIPDEQALDIFQSGYDMKIMCDDRILAS